MDIFIGEPITVEFKIPLAKEKTPTCPDGFTWRETYFVIERSLQDWVDFSRHGKFERNMRESHLTAAQYKGSFGVGRFNFQVQTASGRSFEIYYDRAPTKSNKSGSWMLFKELDLK
jgi:hypothetical protein